jgi:hypothetical protein
VAEARKPQKRGSKRFTSFQVDRPPTGRGPTATGHFWDVFRKLVVERQFFSTPDRLTAQIKNMAPADHGVDIGVAAMVKVLGSAATDRAIERPVAIEREQVDHAILLVTAPLGLFAVDALAGILHHLTASRYVFRRVYTPAVDP